jgi:uncharacterized protein YceK
MDRRNNTALVAIAAAALVQGCSTMDRINAQDWTPYSGTKAASAKGNANAVDTASSAVADTLLLPFTASSYAFGYRYDPGAHAMRQTANNWGWSDYPPTWGMSGARPSSTASGTTMSTNSGTAATGSTGSSTAYGTGGGTPAMGSTKSPGVSPDGTRPPSSTMGTGGVPSGTTSDGDAGTSGGATSGSGAPTGH